MRKYNYNIMFDIAKKVSDKGEARELTALLASEYSAQQAFRFFEEKEKRASKIVSVDAPVPILNIKLKGS